MIGKNLLLVTLILSIFTNCYSQSKNGLTELYNRTNSNRSGIAMGGIGAGSVEIRKNGQFYNWSIMNNWPVFTGDPLVVKSYPENYEKDSYLFFIVRYQIENEAPKIKLLQINDGLSEAGMESVTYYYPWISAIENIEYNGTFPFVNIKYTDSEMPFDIHLEAFSPFIPHDVKNSSLPGINFNFTITSHSKKTVQILLIGSMRNLVGYNTTEKYFTTEEINNNQTKGFSMSCGGMDTLSSSYGQMGLFSSSKNCNYYLGWEHKHPYYELLLMNDTIKDINDTENRNSLKNGTLSAHISKNSNQRCFSSLGISNLLLTGQSLKMEMVMTWNFPNLYGAKNVTKKDNRKDYSIDYQATSIQGHYYNNFFNSAIEVADYMIQNKSNLYKSSKDFMQDFFSSDLNPIVLNQINSQFNTFVTSSTFTKNGKFAIREGLTPAQPWGPNGTIDVSLYGSAATIALFPELEKNFIRIHKSLQSEKGEINHGLSSDLEQILNGTWGVYHRIDLVPNYIQIVLRDFLWTGDIEFLKEMWPSVVKGINYILNERDDNKDLMPDMEGIMCSYDNFPMYGLASYIQSQWLAALEMVKATAGIVNDQETLALANKISAQGKALMENKLWNGSYYNLSNDYNGKHGIDNGILTDQIIGQWMIYQTGLGYLFPKENIDRSLVSIMNSSFTSDFGLRNCTWPEYPDLYPIHETDLWVDQANTCWSGVELGFAGLLLYEGKTEDAFKIIKTVDDRYKKAGLYWDHQEFGGHYYRPLSAWSIINGYLGLGINNGNYSFSPKLEENEYKIFFSYGNGMAFYEKLDEKVNLIVQTGTLNLKSISIPVIDGLKSANLYINDKKINAKSILKDGNWIFSLNTNKSVTSGSVITIK